MNWLHHPALASGLAFAAAVPLSAAHAQTAVVKRSTELRESPADNAPSLGQIPANTQVTRTSERNGPGSRCRRPKAPPAGCTTSTWARPTRQPLGQQQCQHRQHAHPGRRARARRHQHHHAHHHGRHCGAGEWESSPGSQGADHSEDGDEEDSSTDDAPQAPAKRAAPNTRTAGVRHRPTSACPPTPNSRPLHRACPPTLRATTATPGVAALQAVAPTAGAQATAKRGPAPCPRR